LASRRRLDHQAGFTAHAALEGATDLVLNELHPRGVDARAPSAPDRVLSTRLDATAARVAALLASCPGAASERREGRRRAVFIARATRARAP